MNSDRLEALLKYHPFTRLNRLLESVTPPAGNTPILLHLGEPQFQPPALIAAAIAAHADQWGRYPPTAARPSSGRGQG
jgi:N-succinyldiaminopimelate aminotransferase